LVRDETGNKRMVLSKDLKSQLILPQSGKHMFYGRSNEQRENHLLSPSWISSSEDPYIFSYAAEASNK